MGLRKQEWRTWRSVICFAMTMMIGISQEGCQRRAAPVEAEKAVFEKQSAGSPFVARTYELLNQEGQVTLRSPEELEIHTGGKNLVCTYSQQGDTLRVLVNTSGTTEAIYLKITADGVLDVKTLEDQLMNDARKIVISCIKFASDHDGKYPDTLQELVSNHLMDESVLQRAGSPGFEYLGRGKTDASIQQPESTPLVISKQVNGDGKRVVGYVDGHASFAYHKL